MLSSLYAIYIDIMNEENTSIHEFDFGSRQL
jgi:hypothetical protein